MADQELRRVRFHVTGEVQGVGFRAATRGKATALGLCGFVQNRPDGSVDGEAEGPVPAVAAFTFWLHKGPPLAQVTHVEIEDAPPEASAGATFEVRR
jgi:acylphosphatase